MPAWLLIAICMVVWAGWETISKLSSNNMTPVTVQITQAYCYMVIGCMLYAYARLSGEKLDFNWPGIGWVALGSTLAVIGNMAFLTALKKMDLHLVIGITAAYPVLTFLMCWLFLGEHITMLKIIGIIVTVVGLALLTL